MLDKLKSRTEWQAYLVTIITLFCNHFLGLDMDAATVTGLVGATGLYGVSRGLAKNEPSPASVAAMTTATAAPIAESATAAAGDAG